MQISVLPAAQAAALVPLNLQVQRVHSDADPARYVADPDPADVARFLTDWLMQDGVTALIAGPLDAPEGYLIYQIEQRPASVLRHAECRAMLHHICVDTDHRRQGIAQALISAMRAQADVRAADTVWTSYGAFNTASAALMRDAGFAPNMIFALLAAD